MKQYAIINHPSHSAFIISTNSLEFPDYMLLGYQIIFQGNRKECERLMEMEGAMAD